MAVETKEKEIDGRVVMVTQFLGTRSLLLKARLLKLIGPSLAKMLSEIKVAEGEDVQLSFFSSAMDKLIERLDEDQLTALILDLFAFTRIDGVELKKTTFDTEFAGNLMLMYKMLWFVLEVNYGSFFGQAGIGKLLSSIPGRKSQTQTLAK